MKSCTAVFHFCGVLVTVCPLLPPWEHLGVGRGSGGAVGKSLSTMSIQAWICPFCIKLKMEHFDNIQTVLSYETCGNLLAWPRRLSEIGPQLSAPVLAPATLSFVATEYSRWGERWVLATLSESQGLGRLQLWDLPTQLGWVMWSQSDLLGRPYQVQCHNLRCVDWKKKKAQHEGWEICGFKIFLLIYFVLAVLAALGLGCCFWDNSSSGEEHGPWGTRAQ